MKDILLLLCIETFFNMLDDLVMRCDLLSNHLPFLVCVKLYLLVLWRNLILILFHLL